MGPSKLIAYDSYPSEDSPHYFRVHLHPSRAAFARYLRAHGRKDPQKWFGVCSTPSISYRHLQNCIGEVNFWYPYIYQDLIAHEFWHAVINWFAFNDDRAIVPPKEYTSARRMTKKLRPWSDMHEKGANAMQKMVFDWRQMLITQGVE